MEELMDTQWECPLRPLDCIFAPRHVAVIGATDKAHSVGRTVLSKLLRPLHRLRGSP